MPDDAGAVSRPVPRLRRFAAPLLAGVLLALGQAPWNLWPVALAALAALAWQWRSRLTPRAAFTHGWLVGVGYFGVALHWIVEPFLVDAATHGPLAPVALIALASGMALFWGGATAAARWLVPGPGAVAGAAALALGFTAFEALRSYLFTGFPWAQVASFTIDMGLGQTAALVGIFGLNLVTVFLVALAALGTARRSLGLAIAALVALLAVEAAGLMRVATLPTVAEAGPRVRLVQPNAPQHLKWQPDMIPVFFERKIGLTAARPEGLAAPDLILWPETAVPVDLERAGPAFDVMAEAAGGVPIVTGIQRFDGTRAYNSLVVLGADGTPGDIYDKHHLVPFGEYMPLAPLFARIGVFGLAARAERGYSPGPGPRLIDLGTLGRALPLICYEGIFPRNTRTAERPDWLLLLTNDAWFGSFAGPYQHLAQARFRAVEQGLPMLRAANTGVSGLIDPVGRVSHIVPLDVAGFRDVPLPDPLPPTVYARIGDLGPLALWIVAFLPLVVTRARKSH